MIVNAWLFLRLLALTDLLGFAVVRLAVEILKKVKPLQAGIRMRASFLLLTSVPAIKIIFCRSEEIQ